MCSIRVGDERREKILSYLGTLDPEYAPSLREITSAVGLNACSTTLGHLRILERAGLIARTTHGAHSRRLRLTGRGRTYLGLPPIVTMLSFSEELQERIRDPKISPCCNCYQNNKLVPVCDWCRVCEALSG